MLKKNASVPILMSLHMFAIKEADPEDEETGKNKGNVSSFIYYLIFA